jgi:diguanylate cyclase (GGDEF)-like protein
MITMTPVNIAFIFISLQILITCVFFYEKNPHIKGIKTFALSALGLLAMHIMASIIDARTTSSGLLQFLHAIFFVISYYFLCRAFIELLNIRSFEKLEKYWIIFTLITCGALLLPDISHIIFKVYIELTIGIAPIIYLLYLLHDKVRLTDSIEEAMYLSYILMLIVVVRVIYIGTDTAPLVSPESLTSLLPDTLNAQFKFVGQITLLFMHVALVISFLLFVFRFKENELKRMGEIDALTGAYNRKAFFEKIAKINRKSDSFLIMLDADFFKNVNDKYGHVTGDEALKHIANVVKACISKEDIFARYGGEEFILAVTHCNVADVKGIAERIRNQIEQTPLHYNNIDVQLTVSVGVSKLGSGAITEDIEIADKMLYRAKNEGRNKVVFEFG